jgi:hypothetical protein
VAAINLIVAIFFAFACAALMSRALYTTDWVESSESYGPLAYSGLRGGLWRYILCAAAAALLQLVLAVFNLSVLPYIENDQARVNRLCLSIGIVSYVVMVGIGSVLIALSLR